MLVIIYVSTDNLVLEEPEEVATKMDGLIKDLKCNAGKRTAVSSVVIDMVTEFQPARFNDLANNLCTKHNTTFSKQ